MLPLSWTNQLKGSFVMKNNKYSFEFKFKVVQAYLNNEGSYVYIAKKYGVTEESIVRKWVFQYETYGTNGLMKQMSHRAYTSEFKLDVLNYRQLNQLSYRDTAKHFGISNPSMIASWHRKVRDEGPSALQAKRKGRATKVTKDTNKNQKPLNETEREELERLRQEVRMAELENIILKKLNALPKDPYDRK